MRTSRSPLSLVSTLAFAALVPTAALAQTAAGARSRRAARAGLHAHRERRPLQPIHLPRHRADRRQACRARRLRLGAFERLLPRHLGVEHQLARGFRPVHAVEPRMGFLRRLQEQFPRQRRLELRRRHALLLLPRQPQSRLRQRQHVGTLRRAQLEVARREGVVQPRRTTSARSPPARRRTAPGTSTSTPTIRSAKPASRSSATSGSSTSPRRKRQQPRPRTTTGSSAPRTRCPTGLLKGVEVGAYYSGNDAEEGASTPTSPGYNTAKDTGVVYVKKTF